MFFKRYPNIKQQYTTNFSKCFLQHETHAQQIVKHYVLQLPLKKDVPQLRAFMMKLFFHDGINLMFSCSLEVSPKYIEIHDVCVGTMYQGMGLCKLYMPKVLEYIKKTFTQGTIKIVCDIENAAACKCYTSIFGIPTNITRNTAYFQFKY